MKNHFCVEISNNSNHKATFLEIFIVPEEHAHEELIKIAQAKGWNLWPGQINSRVVQPLQRKYSWFRSCHDLWVLGTILYWTELSINTKQALVSTTKYQYFNSYAWEIWRAWFDLWRHDFLPRTIPRSL